MIVVVGPGRCASSSVAKFLHDHGVFMGHRFVAADDNNPTGYYEDVEFNWLNNGMLKGYLSRPAWGAAIKDIISRRVEPWGFKDPKTADLIGLYLGILRNPKFIRCRRDRQQVFDSYLKAYRFDDATINDMIDRRERNLDEHLAGCPVLDVEPGKYDDVMEFCRA